MKNLFTMLIGSLLLISGNARADQVILDDLIVDGSACVGQDCVNGESFGFDTIRLKENNLRIKFQDTSNSASFPSNDWQITANDSSNGGANKFSIDDIDGGRTPFTIEAGAPSHSLYVDDGGKIGLGTSTPVVEVHIKDGDTPTLRLEQDGSSGFTPQTWDVAGNETNFFVRDVTNGSQLPFRIQPGADSNSLFIASDNQIGLGTSSPDALLHLQKSGAGNDGLPRILFDNGDYTNPNSGDGDWFLDVSDTGVFRISLDASGVTEAGFQPNGDLEITGSFVSNGMTLNVPDYVFDPKFQLRPLDDIRKFIQNERHLPNVPSATEIKANGINITQFQLALLEKIEELTLYTLEQQDQINSLKSKLNKLTND